MFKLAQTHQTLNNFLFSQCKVVSYKSIIIKKIKIFFQKLQKMKSLASVRYIRDSLHYEVFTTTSPLLLMNLIFHLLLHLLRLLQPYQCINIMTTRISISNQHYPDFLGVINLGMSEFISLNS